MTTAPEIHASPVVPGEGSPEPGHSTQPGATDGVPLEWETFAALRLGGRRPRHDLRGIVAYLDYRRSLEASADQRSEETERRAGLRDWESEGGQVVDAAQAPEVRPAAPG